MERWKMSPQTQFNDLLGTSFGQRIQIHSPRGIFGTQSMYEMNSINNCFGHISMDNVFAKKEKKWKLKEIPQKLVHWVGFSISNWQGGWGSSSCPPALPYFPYLILFSWIVWGSIEMVYKIQQQPNKSEHTQQPPERNKTTTTAAHNSIRIQPNIGRIESISCIKKLEAFLKVPRLRSAP